MRNLDFKHFGKLPILFLVLSCMFATTANATYHFNKATTCKSVQTNYPYGPVNETTEFQQGETVYSWMELTNVYGSIKGKFEWIKPDGYVYTSATTPNFHVTNGKRVRMYAPKKFYNNYGQWQIRFYISHNGGAYQLQDTKTCNYGGCNCAAVFDPVCGSDGNTYGNACEAQCAGVWDYTSGPCGSTCTCPANYDPVCGSDGNTYNNACLAQCANVWDYTSGACSSTCTCPANYDPVCGSDGNTYNNACLAQCANVWDYTSGECNTGGTTCDLLTRITFNNDLCSQCLTEIAVYEYNGQSYLVYDGRNSHCSDALTTVVNCDTGAQVCQIGGIAGFSCGNLFNFNNAVKKEVVLTDDCGGGCVCPTVVNPVCGSDGNTYNNSCEADCAGVTWTQGACGSNNGCACTNHYSNHFCDDFQDYEPWKKLGPQSSCWTTWTGQEGGAKDADVRRNNTTTNQYLKIKGNNPSGGGHQDVVLQLGDRTSGCYHLDFKIWLFSGHKGYYNIMHKFKANGSSHDDEWASNVYFDGHGSGRLIVKNVAHYFTYKMGEWINVSQHFDLDNDLTELHIDGKKVHRWRFSNQATKTHAGTKKLSAIDFYPVNNQYEFYIDDVEFKKASNLSQLAESRSGLSEAFGSVEIVATELSVLPNPFDHSIAIQIPENLQNGELMISDQLGRVIRQVSNLDDKVGQAITLDVSDLESGIYIVRIAAKGKVYMKKIVKHSF